MEREDTRKFYEPPEAEVMRFEGKDIITDSSPTMLPKVPATDLLFSKNRHNLY